MATLRLWTTNAGSTLLGTVQVYRKEWAHDSFDFDTVGTPAELLADWSVLGGNVQAGDLLDEIEITDDNNDAKDLLEFTVPDGVVDFLIVSKRAFVDHTAPAGNEYANVYAWDPQVFGEPFPSLAAELEQSNGSLEHMGCEADLACEAQKMANLFTERLAYADAWAGPAADSATFYNATASAGQELQGADFVIGQLLLHFDLPQPPGQEHAEIAGTPAHFIVNSEGGAIYPVIAGWTARHEANGGWVGATGRIPGRLVREHPEVLTDGALWVTVVKETGEWLFAGDLKRPPNTEAVVDLSSDGPATIANREIEHLLYREDGTANWSAVDDEVFRQEPTEAPRTGDVTTGQAAGLGGGEYKWAVTFEGPQGESGLGPAVALELDPLGPTMYHVEIRDIPRGEKHVTARHLYRKNPAGAAYQLVTTINDNTTETFTDTVPNGSLGANGPRAKEATSISVQVKKGAIRFDVPADGFVLADEIGEAQRWASEADLTQLVTVVDLNRDAPNWELVLLSGDGPKGELVEETVQDLGNVGESFRIVVDPLDRDSDMVRVRLRRKTAGQDTDPLRVTVRQVKLYGAAPSDEFYASDMVRDIAGRLNVEDREHIASNSVPVLPAVFEGGTFKDPLDVAAILTLWRWLIYRRNLRLCMDFRPYSRRIWRAIEGEYVDDLLPEPRYNRVRLPWKWENDVATDYAVAIANPNPMDHLETAPPLEIERPGSKERAEQLAQTLADHLASDRWSGTLEFARVQDEHGIVWPHTEVREGDQIFVPSIAAALNIDILERSEVTSVADFPSGIFPLLERYNERRRKAVGI